MKFHFSSRLRRSLVALAPLTIACGPFFYQAPPPLARYPQRTAGKTWHDILTESQPSNGISRDQILDEARKFFEEFSQRDEASRQPPLN